MSEWIKPKLEDVTYDKDGDTIDVYIESNDFGARYVTIPYAYIKYAGKKKLDSTTEK